MSEHNPFSVSEQADPRVRELIKKPFLWDCVYKLAPLGRDKSFDAYYE